MMNGLEHVMNLGRSGHNLGRELQGAIGDRRERPMVKVLLAAEMDSGKLRAASILRQISPSYIVAQTALLVLPGETIRLTLRNGRRFDATVKSCADGWIEADVASPPDWLRTLCHDNDCD